MTRVPVLTGSSAGGAQRCGRRGSSTCARARALAGDPGLVAAIEIAGDDAQLVQQRGRGVPALPDLAVDDDRSGSELGETLAERVERQVAGFGDRACGVLACGPNVEQAPAFCEQGWKLIRVHDVAVAAQ